MSVIPLFLISLLLPMGFLARRITRPVLSNVLTWLGLLCMGLGSSLFVFALLREVALLAAQGFYGLWPSVSPAGALSSFRTDTALLVPVLGLLVTLWGFSNARRTAAVVNAAIPFVAVVAN